MHSWWECDDNIRGKKGLTSIEVYCLFWRLFGNARTKWSIRFPKESRLIYWTYPLIMCLILARNDCRSPRPFSSLKKKRNFANYSRPHIECSPTGGWAWKAPHVRVKWQQVMIYRAYVLLGAVRALRENKVPVATTPMARQCVAL